MFPVTIKLPDIFCVNADEPVVIKPFLSPPLPVATVIGNVLPSPFVKVITLSVADAVNKSEPVLTLAPAFNANEAVVAKDAVPIRFPVILPEDDIAVVLICP